MNSLRIFNPEGSGSFPVSAASSLSDFFERWYVPEATQNKSRKPTGPKTIQKRRDSVNWWRRLMATAARPDGPPLGEITESELELFLQRLSTATYRRGPLSQLRHLSEVTQIQHVKQIQIVLRAAGPTDRRLLRAAILSQSPALYLEPIEFEIKETWPIEAAKQLAAAACNAVPSRHAKISVSDYQRLAKGTLALWFYTGHRATTYSILTWDCLTETKPGVWKLKIRHSIKTRKSDTLIVHPQLAECLLECKGLDETYILPWPLNYRAVQKHHKRWQIEAGLTAIFPPQAWRRLHLDEIAKTPYETAAKLASDAAQHASRTITEQSYSTMARDMAILSLPDLF